MVLSMTIAGRPLANDLLSVEPTDKLEVVCDSPFGLVGATGCSPSPTDGGHWTVPLWSTLSR
jgi:hypothetical protein